MPSSVLEELKSFYQVYFNLVGETEAPIVYHRWVPLSCISALLGRQAFLPFGHWVIYPNQYIMLMGNPGARKNTAISIGQKALERIGYDKFAADRSSKERFLIDLIGEDAIEDEDQLLEMTLEGMICEQFIVAEEFTDFTGKNNVEFLTMLAKLWDNPSQYKQPKIHGKSVHVNAPTVNILAGNTPQAFYLAMPPESMGQGLMSRLLFIHGESTGKKITIPKAPTAQAKAEFDALLLKISRNIRGPFKLAEGTEAMLDRLYKEFVELEDYRFKHYNSRRFTHLLKLSMIFAACRLSMNIEPEDCLAANTLLHRTELKMPLALGEYGKARNADIANAVIEIIKSVKKPVTTKYLWQRVAQDLNRQEELQEIVRNLQQAGKLKVVTDPATKLVGYVTNFETSKSWGEDLLLGDFLTKEEMA